MSHLIKWDPFRELSDIQGRLTSLLTRDREGAPVESDAFLTKGDWAPAVDVSEDDQEYLITADLPDVEKDQVSVTVDNGILTITGERQHENEENDTKKKFHRIERSYGKYCRTFRVPDDVDAANVKAGFKNGVLKVHLPKSEARNPKAIDVKVH